MLPVLLIGVFTVTSTPPLTQTGTAPLSLTAVLRAQTDHPRARAALEHARAARLRVEAAGYLPDPMFLLSANNVPLFSAIDASPMTGLQFRLQQTIPWPTKLERRTALSRAQADVASVRPHAVKLDLAREVGLTFFQIHLLDVTAQVYQANDRILSTFIEVADAKYRAGRGRQQDVLRARLSRDELRQRLLETHRLRSAAAATLAQLVGESPPWPVPLLVDIPVASLRPSLTPDTLLLLAETHSPELQAARMRQTERATAAALADSEAWPDLQLSLAYTLRGDAQGRDPARGSDFFSLVVGVDLPVQSFRRRPSVVATAQAERENARFDEQAVRLRIKEAIAGTLDQLPQLQRQMMLLKDEIIPATRQTLEVERAAYQVDRDDMLSLLQTELSLIGRLIEFHTRHVEQEVLFIELSRTLGVPRDDLIEVSSDIHQMHEVHPR